MPTMTKKKSSLEKLNEKLQTQVKRIEIDFADIPAGSNMLIPTPQIIDSYINQIGYGKRINPKIMRKDLALAHHADYTCPVTTGIFLRIVAEANYEKLLQGMNATEITPFWRVIEPNSPLAKKLTFGQEFILKQLENEEN